MYTLSFSFHFFSQAQTAASQMEKKQKKVDAQINEWKVKCDEVQTELEGSQKTARQASAEVNYPYFFFIPYLISSLYPPKETNFSFSF